MKKKVLILVLIIIALAVPVTVTAGEVGTDPGAGKMKLGGILGYGLTATLGLDSGGLTEWNFLIGTDWSFRYFYGGVNLLFTLVDIDISGEIFPLSLGPQVNIGYYNAPDYYGLDDYYDDSIEIDLLAVLRWEYTFDFPLNLFVETGLGVALNFSDYYSSPAHFAWTVGVGARYVFGM